MNLPYKAALYRNIRSVKLHNITEITLNVLFYIKQKINNNYNFD